MLLERYPMPSLFTYLDHRRFLADWFEAKCEQNPRYSHRLFASKAGVSNPSLLHLIIQGKRNLTANTLPGFLKALQLNADERKHFRLLVALDRADSQQQRSAIFEKIRATKHFRAANELETASFDYLSDWTLPAIRELAGCPDFRWDPAWIAGRLHPTIREAHARRSLATLERLGMLKPTDDGGALQQDQAIVTQHEVGGLAVFNYHRTMLERAEEALESVDAELRHYGAVTVRVNPDRLADLKAEVAAFQERVLALCDDQPDGDRVMQLNLQLFPLSGVP
jgi:uncharacterized protein (TIGR02147 family)